MNNLTIFYTDDDDDDLSIFADAIAIVDQNISLHTFNTAQKLLDAMLMSPPKPLIVFLDLNMPGKNGFDVLAEINGINDRILIPIVVFSTSNDSYIINKCRDLGAHYFATKPVTMSDIVNIIKYIISVDWENAEISTEEFVYKLS